MGSLDIPSRRVSPVPLPTGQAQGWPACSSASALCWANILGLLPSRFNGRIWGSRALGEGEGGKKRETVMGEEGGQRCLNYLILTGILPEAGRQFTRPEVRGSTDVEMPSSSTHHFSNQPLLRLLRAAWRDPGSQTAAPPAEDRAELNSQTLLSE